MAFDSIWNSFLSSGNVNDYITYKKKKEEQEKKIKEMQQSKSTENKQF